MNPCKNCLENQWTYLFDDKTGIVTATCKYCGAEISFESKRARRARDPRYQPKPCDVPLNNYTQQDDGDDGRAPW
jgi:transcription elongation factor Elf1